MGTGESVFTRIMARRSWMQIRLIAAKYEGISGNTLIQAINDECHGDTERAYKAMKGLGTDDDALVRNIIFTSEWALETVKARYEEEYGATISDDIDGDCRGDYKDILQAIVK